MFCLPLGWSHSILKNYYQWTSSQTTGWELNSSFKITSWDPQIRLYKLVIYTSTICTCIILMRLAQLSELPEVTEPSSSLSACILRYIRLRLLASLSACALIFLLSQRSVERVPQAFFTLWNWIMFSWSSNGVWKYCYVKLFLWLIAMLFHLIIMELNSSNSKANDRVQSKRPIPGFMNDFLHGVQNLKVFM